MGAVRVRILVEGRVQGVWFRESARREADSMGVAGWVRNLSDGRVEAVFEGEPSAVNQMVAWAQEGPTAAHVTGYEIHDEDPQGQQGFRVR